MTKTATKKTTRHKDNDGATHKRMRDASKPPKKRKAKAMADQDQDQADVVIELNGRIEKLETENEGLRRELASATKSKPAAAAPLQSVTRWKRGKLPGEVFIKTDLDTGRFFHIEKAEYDALA